MYYECTITDTLRVPPTEFGDNLSEKMLKLAQKEYEGVLDEEVGVVVAVTAVERVGEGTVVPGDGSAYYDCDFRMLTYKPEMQEYVEGTITDITEFGAFLRIGPIEGLIHVSQVMDDYINYDAKLPGFIGKETGNKLMKGDKVDARIVTISIKGTISASKIGLTMRQEGLGKEGWALKPGTRKDSPRTGKKEKAAEKE